MPFNDVAAHSSDRGWHNIALHQLLCPGADRPVDSRKNSAPAQILVLCF